MAIPLVSIAKRILELRRTGRMSREDLESRKLEKFRTLVHYVQRNSPYYADIIAEHGIQPNSCVPSDFPVLTKSTLMANFDRIITDKRISKAKVSDFLTRSTDPNELLLNTYHVLHTSGSSGEMGYFLFTEDEWIRGMLPAAQWQGPRGRHRRRRFRRIRIAYYAAVGGHFAGVSMVSSARRGFARLFVDVSLFEINSPLPDVIEQLNRLQPDFLGGYTTGLKILAENQNRGLLKISPIRVGTAGESMTPADKTLIESAFKCEAHNGYGSTEHLIMGGANPDGETMTLYDSDLIYEIFDDHTLVTNLFNYTQPLIRYKMSDVLRPVQQENPSSPFLVVDSLVGRSEKIPTFLNRYGAEDFIHPISIVELFIAGVSRFQMRLVDNTRFRFAVVLDPSLPTERRDEVIADTHKRLRDLLNQKQMDNVVFEVVPVADIPVDPKTGKFKLIVGDADGF